MDDLLVQIPEDVVLQHIAPHLDYLSWLRATAVSRPWRQLFQQFPPPGEDIPWIAYNDEESNVFALAPQVNSTSPHLIIHKLPVTGWLMGSYHNYVITMSPVPDQEDTMQAIAFDTISKTPPFPLTGHSWDPPPGKARAILSSSPASPDCVAAVFVPQELELIGRVVFFRPQHDEPSRSFSIGRSSEMIFHQGEIYYINRHAWDEDQLMAVNLHDEHLQPRIVAPITRLSVGSSFLEDFHLDFLVESCGELLVVTKHTGSTFTVRRVDKEERKLVKVDDLGDRMLFIGGLCSRSIFYGSRERPSQFFTSNCIYFFQLVAYDSYRLGRYSLATKLVSLDENPIPFPNKWFPPKWITHP